MRHDLFSTVAFCTPTPPIATTFDFALAHSGDKAISRGQSVSNIITATLITGSSQMVSFTTSGLRAGATASYVNSNSCNPTCSRTLNIATASSTPTGSFSISVTGTGGGVTRTSTFNLTVTSAVSAEPAGNTVTVEAETGTLIAPMVIRSDATASGEKFVEAPEGSGNNYTDATRGGPGQVRFTINISQAGTRALWARTIAPDGGSDSFYVIRNGTRIRSYWWGERLKARLAVR